MNGKLRQPSRGGFRGGGGGGGGGSRGSGPPLSYMKNDVMLKNDVMHTVIYAAFCMLPSFAGLHIVLAKRDLDRSN